MPERDRHPDQQDKRGRLGERGGFPGFDGAAALRDRFRRAVGVSPKAWRRSLGMPAGQARPDPGGTVAA